MSAALVVVTAMALFTGLISGWAESTVFNSREFADRAVAALDSSSFRQALAEKIADAVSREADTSLVSLRPALVSIIEDIEGSEAFRDILRDAIEQTHRAVFSRRRGQLRQLPPPSSRMSSPVR
jgi:hypothetical protein